MDDKVIGGKIREKIRKEGLWADELTHETLVRILKECNVYDRIMQEVEDIERESY